MSKRQRWVALFDSHGDMQDDRTVELARKFVERYKPHHRIHGGDALDLRAFRKGASEAEKRESVQPDFDAAAKLFGWFKPTVWLLGNHCQRAIDRMNGDDKCEADMTRSMWGKLTEPLKGRTKIIPYCKWKGFYRLSDFRFCHGMHHGENAARQAANDFKCNVIQGHVHAFAVAPVASISGPVYGYTAPAMCRRDMGYARAHAKTLRHELGWLFGETDGRHLTINVARVIDGKLYAGT